MATVDWTMPHSPNPLRPSILATKKEEIKVRPRAAEDARKPQSAPWAKRALSGESQKKENRLSRLFIFIAIILSWLSKLAKAQLELRLRRW